MTISKSKRKAGSSKSSRPSKRNPSSRPPAKIKKSQPNKPDDTWVTILIKAFTHDYARTLTYKEQEIFSWILTTYPYYKAQYSTLQANVKKTLGDYDCFRNVGRGLWTYIETRAPKHLQGMRLVTIQKREQQQNAGLASEDEELEIQQSEQQQEDEAEKDDNETEPEEEDKASETQEEEETDEGINIDSVSAQGEMEEDAEMTDTYHQPSPSPAETTEVIIDDDDDDDIQEEREMHTKSDLEVMAAIAVQRRPLKSPPASPPQTPVDETYKMSPEGWLNLLRQMFQNSRKQKTIREMTTWIRENFPIYQKVPSDWEIDILKALESNPCFQRMGRGRWKFIIDDELASQNEQDEFSSSSSTEEEDWREIGPKTLAFRRHSVAGPVNGYVTPAPRTPKRRHHHSFSSFQPSSMYTPLLTPLSTFRSTKLIFNETDDDEEIEIASVRSTSYFDPRHSPLASPPASLYGEIKPSIAMVFEERLLPSDDQAAIEALALLCASSSPS